MEPLVIQAKEDTPGITMDPGAGKFEVTGKSLPEDVATFYAPVLEWLDNYKSDPLPKTVVEFRLTYFNTASSKIIMDIMVKFEELMEAGNEVMIKWYYPDDDEDMQEAGEEYEELVEVPFEHIPYED